MKVIKETKEYTILQKRSGRYGIRSKDKTWINGDEKRKILLAEGLVKVAAAKAPEPTAAAETTDESSTETAAAAE